MKIIFQYSGVYFISPERNFQNSFRRQYPGFLCIPYSTGFFIGYFLILFKLHSVIGPHSFHPAGKRKFPARLLFKQFPQTLYMAPGNIPAAACGFRQDLVQKGFLQNRFFLCYLPGNTYGLQIPADVSVLSFFCQPPPPVPPPGSYGPQPQN